MLALLLLLNGQFWMDGIGGLGNCHGSALYLAQLRPFLSHQDSMELDPDLCSQVQFQGIREGDIGLIYSSDITVAHSFTIISKDLTFSKNGHGGTKRPYGFFPLEDIANQYFTFVDSDENALPINEYKQNLEAGLDCLRGDRIAIDKCKEAQQVFAVYYRCEPASRTESRLSPWADPTARYFALKARIIKIGNHLVSDRAKFFASGSESFNEIKKIKYEILAELTRTPTRSEIRSLLRQLKSQAENWLDIFDPQSKVYQGVHP